MSNPIAWYKKLDAWSKVWMDRLFEFRTFKDLCIVVLMLSALWAFAWNAHVIGPWIDGVFGFEPSDADPPGKVRWRRIYSTAFCLPTMLAGVFLYLKGLRDRRNTL